MPIACTPKVAGEQRGSLSGALGGTDDAVQLLGRRGCASCSMHGRLGLWSDQKFMGTRTSVLFIPVHSFLLADLFPRCDRHVHHLPTVAKVLGRITQLL